MIVCFCFVWGFIRDKLLRISVCVEWNSLSMDRSYSEKLFHALDKIKKHQVCTRLHVGFSFRFSRNLSCYTNQLYFLYTHQGKNLQRAEFYAVFSVDKQWANNRCLCFCVMQGKVHLELRLSEVITDSGVISHKLATRWGHSYTQTRKHAKKCLDLMYIFYPHCHTIFLCTTMVLTGGDKDTFFVHGPLLFENVTVFTCDW